VRRNLFEAEQGVCQLCQFDAHACFQSVKALQKKDRRGFLEKSVYCDLHSQLLNRMIVDPKEGMVRKLENYQNRKQKLNCFYDFLKE
jgi:hypothetical protein